MKIAVTGATGFIGRHVVDELEARDVEVILLIRPESLDSVQETTQRVVSIDTHHPPAGVFEAIGEPDVLIHLAWSGLQNYHSLHHFEQELPAQYAFLRSLVDAGLRNIVIAGTCYEYGMQSGCLSEVMHSMPGNPYGFAKDVLRHQLQFLQQSCPFNLAWARLFYLYGDGQSETSLFTQLSRAAECGEQQFNMSGGEQLRDYLPVEEVARYLVALAMIKHDVGVVNICSGQPVSIRHLVERWISENGWSIIPNLGHYPYPDYEPMAFWGDPMKLQLLLGECE